MALRRFAAEQPASFAFTADNLVWVDKQIAKYPEGRQASAVIPMLWRAQEQEGWISEPCVRWIAERLGMSFIRVYEIVTFYTMFHMAPVGKVHVQVCGTTPCMLRGAEDLIKVCKSKIAANAKDVTADGLFSWEEVECLGACVNAPMVMIWKDTYEDLTPESLNKVLDGFASGNPPKPGPQIDRQYAAPASGPTSLNSDDAVKPPKGAS